MLINKQRVSVHIAEHHKANECRLLRALVGWAPQKRVVSPESSLYRCPWGSLSGFSLQARGLSPQERTASEFIHRGR